MFYLFPSLHPTRRRHNITVLWVLYIHYKHSDLVGFYSFLLRKLFLCVCAVSFTNYSYALCCTCMTFKHIWQHKMSFVLFAWNSIIIIFIQMWTVFLCYIVTDDISCVCGRVAYFLFKLARAHCLLARTRSLDLKRPSKNEKNSWPEKTKTIFF